MSSTWLSAKPGCWLTVSVVFLPALALLPPAQADPPASPPAQAGATSQPAPIYDANADGAQQVAAALVKARRDNQRVLVMFGGNWCSWCHKLHDLLTNNRGIARLVQYEYQLVLVDVGRMDKNQDLVKSYGIDLKKSGVPFLTVLDADGKVLVNQETGSLEQGQQHDPAKVVAFLRQWKTPPLDAEALFSAARAKAITERKQIFLHLGAPWCIWCHRLEDFLAEPEIARILEPEYIVLKIDVDRMRGGKGIGTRLRDQLSRGLPWFAVVDAGGNVLASSEAEGGNIGFPMLPDEVTHFMDMFKKTTRTLTAEQLARMEESLKAVGAKYKQQAEQGGH